MQRDISQGDPWVAHPVYVVDDGPDLLVTYTPEGAPFGFLPDSVHPWFGRTAWTGHGVLVLRRPGDPYSVWHFWSGDDREFMGWYVNFEVTYERTPIGYDVSDSELDIMMFADGSWSFKDWDLLDEHVRRGRYTQAQVDAIRADGVRIGHMLDAGTQWWDDQWTTWTPDPTWVRPELRPDWSDAPVAIDA